MPTRIVRMFLLVTLMITTLAAHASAQDAKYTGYEDCSRCHKKKLIGNQTRAWKSTRHAKAYATLKTEKALQIAQERGIEGPPSESEKCLGCHATAQGLEPEMFENRPLSVKDGVQCESCHGPGSEYKANEIMSDHDKSVAAGMWEPGKNEKICTACHNEDSPNFEGFDYEKSKEKIAHPIPEEVKGRYLELEEKNKKAPRKRRE